MESPLMVSVAGAVATPSNVSVLVGVFMAGWLVVRVLSQDSEHQCFRRCLVI